MGEQVVKLDRLEVELPICQEINPYMNGNYGDELN